MGPQFSAESNAGGSGGVGAAAPASSASDGGGSGGEGGGGGSGGKGSDDAAGGGVAACLGSPRWVKSYGDALDQVGMSVTADAAGSVVIAGVFQGTIDFGGGPLTAVSNTYSVYVAKLDADGDALWSHAYQGGIDYVAGEGIPSATVAVTPEGGVVLGGEFSGTVDFGVGAPVVATSTIGDGFVLAFDSAGGPLWSVHYGDAPPDPQHPQTVLPQTVESVDVDAQGNVLVLGYRGWGTGGGMFLVKLDSGGNELWKKSVSTSGTMESTVRADASGNVVVAGLAFAALDLGGTRCPSRRLSPRSTGPNSTLRATRCGATGPSPWALASILATASGSPLGNVFVAGGGGDLNLDVGCGLFPSAWTTKVMEFDAASGNCLWNAGFSDFGSAIGVDLSGRPIVATDVVDQIDTYPTVRPEVPGPACVDTLVPRAAASPCTGSPRRPRGTP